MPELFGRIHKYAEMAREAVAPEGIRYINYYLSHACNENCSFCRTRDQKIKMMTREERCEAFRRLRLFTDKHPVISIIGGEPTLLPDFLIEAIEDAKKAAGLDYLAISVDCNDVSSRTDSDSALKHLGHARKLGIIPAVNTVITRNTNTNTFKQFASEVMKNDIFVSLLVCSPCVPIANFDK